MAEVDPVLQASLNGALMRFKKRAEAADPGDLVATFVDTGTLRNLLQSPDHQIIYGRRGTGKTHALRYVADRVRAAGDLSVYLDLRNVGSNGGIYGDSSIGLAERASRLLADVLLAIHDNLLRSALESPRLPQLEAGLDALHRAATKVTVSNAIEGARCRVSFGEVAAAIRRLCESIPGNRMWLLADEWSSIPMEVQPYLADLLRRAVFPVAGTTVKIAAIEHRSLFQLPMIAGDYIGIELGADAAADLYLDDFMVFGLNREKAIAFFRDLLFRHYVAAVEEMDDPPRVVPISADEFVRMLFTQRTPFEELVNAAEGVPRDAMSIAALCAQKAGDRPISVQDVRSAASAWFQRDKQAAVNANATAAALLNWIVDEVIAHRKARAFLFEAGVRYHWVDALFDARVLHIAKRGVSSHDTPGVRYDVYKIDYGTYVDLLATQRAPQGLLALDVPGSGQSHVDVPPDDYRAIRRAILDVRKFEEWMAAQGAGR